MLKEDLVTGHIHRYSVWDDLEAVRRVLKEDLVTFMDMIQKFNVMGHHFSWVASHFVDLVFFLTQHTYSRNVVGEYYVHR